MRSLAGAMVAELERQAAAAAPGASGAPERAAFSDADIRRIAREAGFQPASPEREAQSLPSFRRQLPSRSTGR